MELRVSSALTVIALLAFAPGLSAKGETIKITTAGGDLAAPAEAAATTTGHSPASPSCAITEMVRATPPPTNNAGPIGEGLWWVNDDRSIWMQSATGPWHIGLNQKNMMIK